MTALPEIRCFGVGWRRLTRSAVARDRSERSNPSQDRSCGCRDCSWKNGSSPARLDSTRTGGGWAGWLVRARQAARVAERQPGRGRADQSSRPRARLRAWSGLTPIGAAGLGSHHHRHHHRRHHRCCRRRRRCRHRRCCRTAHGSAGGCRTFDPRPSSAVTAVTDSAVT